MSIMTLTKICPMMQASGTYPCRHGHHTNGRNPRLRQPMHLQVQVPNEAVHSAHHWPIA